MEAHLCNHPTVPHIVWYASIVGAKDSSVKRAFENLEDAELFAQKILRQNSNGLAWLKIHRSDNPLYCCYVWERAKTPEDLKEDNTVKIEVDIEPLKAAFDNIALGFKDQGKAIQKLGISIGLVAGGLILEIASRFFI